MRFFYFLLSAISLVLRVAVVVSPWTIFNTEIAFGPDVVAAITDSYNSQLIWVAITIPLLFFREFRSAGFPLFTLFGSGACAGYINQTDAEHDPAHPFYYLTPGNLGYVAMHDE